MSSPAPATNVKNEGIVWLFFLVIELFLGQECDREKEACWTKAQTRFKWRMFRNNFSFLFFIDFLDSKEHLAFPENKVRFHLRYEEYK